MRYKSPSPIPDRAKACIAKMCVDELQRKGMRPSTIFGILGYDIPRHAELLDSYEKLVEPLQEQYPKLWHRMRERRATLLGH